MMLAPGHWFDVASVNHGGPPSADGESFLKDACPIVASYGARDRSQRGAAEKLKGVLDVLGIDNDVKEYPDAGHSFLNKHPAALAVLLGAAGPEATLPRFFTVLNVVLGPLTGMGFDAEAAADARRRIVSCRDRYLATARDPN